MMQYTMLWEGKMSKTLKILSAWQARGSWELSTKLRQIPIIEILAAARISVLGTVETLLTHASDNP